jgi:hypothetical protein
MPMKNKTSIREVSRIIGILISSFSAVDYGNLHYRILEKEKNYALKKSFRNYDAYINVTSNMISELKWWSGLLPLYYQLVFVHVNCFLHRAFNAYKIAKGSK